jgi:hypothetical protein
METLIHVLLLLFGSTIVALLAWNAVRRARVLNERIQEHKREVEEAKQSGKIVDPYSMLASLYTEPTEKEAKPPSKRRSRRE